MVAAAFALGRSGAWAFTPGLFVDQILAGLCAWTRPSPKLQDDVTLVVVDVAWQSAEERLLVARRQSVDASSVIPAKAGIQRK